MSKKAFYTLAGAAIAMLSSATAMAGENASAGMRISVRIPPMCSISTSSLVVQESATSAASTFFESCNSNRGFQVFATHRPLGLNEKADVQYDGVSAELSRAGMSLVQFRQGARHGPVVVRVAAENLAAPLAVSFAMTPV